MRIDFDGSDYYLYLTSQQLKQALVPLNTIAPRIYRGVEAIIQDPISGKEKHIFLMPTNDCKAINEGGEDSIITARTDDGFEDLLVRTHTRSLDALLKGEKPELMSRQPGSNKIWIRLIESLE